MNSQIEQLAQLANGPVWDGNLISKDDRDALVKAGLVDKLGSLNFLTGKGVEYLINLAIIKA